jgi:hypothetical protein
MMTTGEKARADQKTTVERLLDDEQVLVHINPIFPGVMIPSHLAENKTVTLRLSRYFKGELATDEEKITAELLFGSTYITCVIPWGSIWGASSLEGDEYVWREAAPEEIVHLLRDHADHERPSTLRQPTSDRPTRPSRPNPGHLRRVK